MQGTAAMVSLARRCTSAAAADTAVEECAATKRLIRPICVYVSTTTTMSGGALPRVLDVQQLLDARQPEARHCGQPCDTS